MLSLYAEKGKEEQIRTEGKNRIEKGKTEQTKEDRRIERKYRSVCRKWKEGIYRKGNMRNRFAYREERGRVDIY